MERNSQLKKKDENISELGQTIEKLEEKVGKNNKSNIYLEEALL